MDGIALLSPSHLKPTTTKRSPHAVFAPLLDHFPLSDMLSLLLVPLPIHHLRDKLHGAIGPASLFVCFWAYYIALSSLAGAFYASKFLAVRACIATRFGVGCGITASGTAAANVWCSRTARAIRKKLFHEFATFVLGCGNCVILVLFWPGWLFIGGLVLVLWKMAG